MMRSIVPIAAIALALSWPTAVANAGSPAKPTVVELFTSQSCYSCPPAEAFLGELAQRDDVIALEFHVDYWNDLNYGAAGKWRDLFSKPAYSRRQRVYAQSLPGGRVYTPQMVIDGRYEAVGTRRTDVLGAIQRADGTAAEHLNVAVSSRPSGGVAIRLDGPVKSPGVIWLVRYDKVYRTDVKAGENKGKALTNYNIVRSLQRLGDWRGSTQVIEVPDLALGAGQSCAVIVQSEAQGPMLGAAACPEKLS